MEKLTNAELRTLWHLLSRFYHTEARGDSPLDARREVTEAVARRGISLYPEEPTDAT